MTEKVVNTGMRHLSGEGIAMAHRIGPGLIWATWNL